MRKFLLLIVIILLATISGATAEFAYNNLGGFGYNAVTLSSSENTSLNGSNFLYLPGRAGGQVANGGTAAGDVLMLKSTSHNTKGSVKIQGNDFFTFGGFGGDLNATATTIAYNVDEQLQYFISNAINIGADQVSIGKGSARAKGNNNIVMGKYCNNTKDDTLEVCWQTGNNTASFYNSIHNTIVGNVYNVLNNISAEPLTNNHALRVYGTNSIFENTEFIIQPSTGSAVTYVQRAFGAGANVGFTRAQGTKATPTNIVNGAILGEFYWGGYHSGAYYKTAQMKVTIDAPIGGSPEVPGRFNFLTARDGTTTLYDVMELDSKQNVQMYNNLNVSNNMTGNLIYGGFYIDSRLTNVETQINQANKYYNVTANTTAELLNGFTFSNGELTALRKGVYDCSQSMSFSGGANDEYHSAIGINGVEQYNCHATRLIGAGGDIGNAGNPRCFLNINKGDIITLMVENEMDADNILVEDGGVKCVMVGQ